MTPEQLQSLVSAKLYPQSIQHVGNETYCFAKDGTQHYLLIAFNPQEPAITRDTFSGEVQDIDQSTAVKWCMPSYSNAHKLRKLFPWTAPQPLGLKTSFGAGDRMGLAAPAHIQAARTCGNVSLILAQQSIREMTRTQRTPDQVLDAATWGAFQENYQEPWGADADHLKTEEDVQRMVEAGFTFFTIDPSEHVDDDVLSYSDDELATRFAALEGSDDWATRYLDQSFEVQSDELGSEALEATQHTQPANIPLEQSLSELGVSQEEVQRARAGVLGLSAELAATTEPPPLDEAVTEMLGALASRSSEASTALSIRFTRETLMRAALKYGRAVAHTAALAAVLDEVKGSGNYDLEMSVDETETPTTVAEHYFVANELKRSGITVQSLAIRFIGEFQKGIDYIGDLAEFEARLRDHALIARALGPYKISIHSGSDKFSVFPIFGAVCGGLIHEKTAGTWYLEALRVAARREPDLFREICDFAAARFMTDRATYHVAQDLSELPDYTQLEDSELERVIDNNTGRQMLHVTFGSVLTDKKENGGWRFRDRIYQLLLTHEDLHHEVVREHSLRHMQALGMCGS